MANTCNGLADFNGTPNNCPLPAEITRTPNLPNDDEARGDRVVRIMGLVNHYMDEYIDDVKNGTIVDGETPFILKRQKPLNQIPSVSTVPVTTNVDRPGEDDDNRFAGTTGLESQTSPVDLDGYHSGVSEHRRKCEHSKSAQCPDESVLMKSLTDRLMSYRSCQCVEPETCSFYTYVTTLFVDEARASFAREACSVEQSGCLVDNSLLAYGDDAACEAKAKKWFSGRWFRWLKNKLVRHRNKRKENDSTAEK